MSIAGQTRRLALRRPWLGVVGQKVKYSAEILTLYSKEGTLFGVVPLPILHLRVKSAP